MNHEKLLIDRFIQHNKKEKYLALLENPNKRKKFVKLLAHDIEFDSKYALKIPSNLQNIEDIESLLRAKGAVNKCYVFSENSRIDGKEILLHDALMEIIGYSMGTFLSIIPGKLAYYEGEDSMERYILYRKE